MKKILFLALAAATVMSCTESEEIENAGQKTKVEFGTIVKGSTRAVITTTDNFEKFTVNGYKTSEAMGTGVQLATGFMDDVVVAKSGETWGYDGTYYWPLTGNVQFFATAPAQTLNITAAGYPTFDYTVKAATDSQEDLIAANVIDKTKESGAIILPFQHLLTQVNFSIKGGTPDFVYTVTKLTLKGIKNTATFTFDGQQTVGTWGNQTASGADYTFTGSKVVAPDDENKDAITAFEETNKALFMLMPQTLAGATLEITYTAAPSGKPTEYTYNDTKKLNLTGDWGMGKNIRYTLVLTNDASPVTFGKPTIGGWIDEVGEDTTDVK